MTARRAVFACLAAFAAWGGMGCGFEPSHVHSPSRANAAKQAQALHTTYREGVAGMYAAMLVNVDRVQVQEDLTLSELADRFSDALTTQIPTITVGGLLQRIEAAQKKAQGIMRRVAEKGTATKAEELKAEDAAKAAKAAIASAAEEVKKAEALVNRWNLQTALFQKLLSEGANAAKKVSQATDKKTAACDAMRQIANAKIAFVDAQGREQTIEGNKSKESKEKLKELGIEEALFETFLKPVFDRLEGVEGQKVSALADAPGLVLVLADLGLTLATLEQARQQAELVYLRDRMTILEHTYTQVVTADAMLKDAATTLGGAVHREAYRRVVAQAEAEVAAAVEAAVHPDAKAQAKAEAILKAANEEASRAKLESDKLKALTLVRLLAGLREGAAKVDEKTAKHWPGNRLFEPLYAVRTMGVAECVLVRHDARLDLALSRLDHAQSIQRSNLADAAWQALIGSGLDGLVAFHEGGLKPEQVSQILQSTLLAALALHALW